MAYLGIDLGTSGLKALLIDADGTPVGTADRTYTTQHPHPGWSEQDPAAWTDALDAVMSDLRAQHPAFAVIKGIGVSGHMHGATLLDAEDRVLRPCILWNDTRAFAEAAALDGMDGVREISGNIVFPGFTAPKLEWVARHEPQTFARVAKVLLPAAYLNLHLSGEHVTDMSDAAGTAWLDVGTRKWSERLLDASGMRADQMPRLVEGSDEAGTLRPELATRWGLGPNVIIAGGAGDNAAAACGIGALVEGQGFVSIGTSGVLLTARDGYCPKPETALHTFCHAVPDRWYQMGVMLSASDSLSWLARLTGSSPSQLTGALGDRVLPPGPVSFLPYLSGERTPHNDADIRGAFTGIGTQTTRDDMTRAVLEGVAFGLRDSAEAIRATGGTVDRLWAIGGGAASDYWLRLIATVLNVTLDVPSGTAFGAALGAARLGMAAATGAPIKDIMTPPDAHATFEPETDLQLAFEDAYAMFRKSYPAIKSIRNK
ncbi:xylulokinase [Pseudooceanicola sp. MF1-13]|uniref:xylulokinase n=1 Tax=Pseudooceanicola sp. MF1-13 TaxID=3379095 RepID=UPI00389246F9